MSALRIERLKKNRSAGFCVNRCQGTNGTRSGRFKVSIAGYPVGVLCPSCAKEARRVWDENLDVPPAEQAAA